MDLLQNKEINEYTGLFKMIVGVQLSRGNSAPNSGNIHHLTIPFKGGMCSFMRQGVCVCVCVCVSRN
jgi:hypothetical protein